MGSVSKFLLIVGFFLAQPINGYLMSKTDDPPLVILLMAMHIPLVCSVLYDN